MNPRIFPTCLLIACGISLLSSFPVAGETSFRSPDVGLKPESSVYGFDGKFYVTLMGGSRVKGDGDGGIVMIDGDKVTPLTKGLDDPKGIVFISNRLITADFDTVWSINAAVEKTVPAGPDAFPKPPVFLNDVAIEPGGKSIPVTEMGGRSGMLDEKKQELIVPDTKAGKLFFIPIGG